MLKAMELSLAAIPLKKAKNLTKKLAKSSRNQQHRLPAVQISPQLARLQIRANSQR
jgi:hypothetical protein